MVSLFFGGGPEATDVGFPFSSTLNSSVSIPIGSDITSVNLTVIGESVRYTGETVKFSLAITNIKGNISIYLNNYLLKFAPVTFYRDCNNIGSCPPNVYYTISSIPTSVWDHLGSNVVKIASNSSICLKIITMTLFYSRKMFLL
jgi:hypothetical protein